MNTSKTTPDPVRATDVYIKPERFYVLLQDGREIGVPYSWFWRLDGATQEEREDWRLIGKGTGIHWEAIDEDISINGILKGKPENPARPTAAELVNV